jgi:glucose/arabinose dehydrogenase
MKYIFWLGTALLCTGFFFRVNAQDVVIERVYPNITISNPVDLQHANDGSGRIFVVSQSGIIYVLDDDQSVTTPPVFMNISSRVRSGGERGLLGLAFHPGYAENGFFYVYYTAETNNQLRSVISRFRVDAGNPGLGDPASELVLLEFNQPYDNHNAGQIAFGPEDGFLYIASGDGGSGGDPANNAQTLSTLLGNILRIDVDNTAGSLNYAIPAGNPFAGNTDGYREEIYAWGLRNPWRMSFDPVTGWLWAADVGQNRVEEINIIENGGNYGWKIMEGSTCYSPSTGCDTTGLILPIWEYTHASGDGRSITGGYVYRGADYPELQGRYFYSDYVSANMWMLQYDGVNEPVNTLLPNPGFSIASFGTDENEELYAMGHQNGQIFRIKIADAIPLPGTPVLISPEDGVTGRPLELFFAWQAAADAETYRLQIGADPGFGTVDFDIQNITATSVQVGELEYETTYYWRVRALNETGAGGWSAVRSFTTEDEPLQVPGAPVLVSPVNGATDVDPDTGLEWEAVVDALWYSVQISEGLDFEVITAGADSLGQLQFSLSDLPGQTTYFWRVRALNLAGSGEWSETWNFTTRTSTSTGTSNNELPVDFELEQNYPNPFNPSTSIRIGIPAGGGAARLEVFDLLGRKVATLVDQALPAGWQTVTFNADNLNSGIYIYRLETAGQTIVRKMMLVK